MFCENRRASSGRSAPSVSRPIVSGLHVNNQQKDPAMNIMSLDAAPQVPVPFDARVMHSDGPVEVIHILLQPGEGVPPHDNPFDVLFYVLEGCGELTIEDQVRSVAADNLIAIPTGTQRGWKNTGSDPVRLLVIKLLDAN